jgi:hypothetical protein
MSVFEFGTSIVAEVHCVREVRLGVLAHATNEGLHFYVDVIGLQPWRTPRVVPGAFGVGNPRRGLLLQVRHDPEVDEVRRRLTLVVASLDELERRLVEIAWPFERVRGIVGSDDRIDLNDPAGHRIEIRQSRPI